MADRAAISDVLTFWYEDCTPEDWFKKDSDFDERLRTRFGALHDQACEGLCDDWAETADGALALILLLDQFSRNLHREKQRAFAQDSKALEVARAAIKAGFDEQHTREHRLFFYVPFEHSEILADQEEGIAHFERYGDEKTLEYAIAHRDIIARFGRFPHRNKCLGRPSTPEELAFLETPGSSF